MRQENVQQRKNSANKKRVNNPRRQSKVANKTKSSNVTRVSSDTQLANDPMWYNMYPDLVESTARISTGVPIGVNLSMAGLSDNSWMFINDFHTMRLSFVHGVGLTENDRDPINLSATKLYSYVRHANSGHSNYERTDLMLYFLSVIEAYNLIGSAMRAYGLINMYNNLNRAMPGHVVEAIGWDYDDLIEHAALLRTRINNAIARVNSLYVPTELNVVKRWWWLNTTLFTDSAGPKAMIYACVPTIYRTWEEMSSDNGGYLKAHTFDAVMTVSKWRQCIDKVLDRLLDSEDIGIISGDILKAYGDRVFTLSMMEENYTTPFVYSEEVLTQINNTSFISWELTGLDITQEVSKNLNTGLRYNPHLAIPANSIEGNAYVEAMCSTPILSFPVENPDNNMVMVATRNTAFIDDVEDLEDGSRKATISSGSEIFTKETIYSTSGHFDFNPTYCAFVSGKEILIHSRFDYCPLVKLYENEGEFPVYVGCSHYENVLPVGETAVSRMHDTALLSLFTALV